ncbi:MAG: hypothetical protein VXW65_11560 [Pseudomonadota bacterium]|nr:hypothetical protein [Pseudomonadota bacterium]
MFKSEALNDIEAFQIKHEHTDTSERCVFQDISGLDKKHSKNMDYYHNIEGAICNIEASRGLSSLLNANIKRLNKKTTTDSSPNLHYNLGNTFFAIAVLKEKSNSMEQILESTDFHQARQWFQKVPNTSSYFALAQTYIGIILQRYGRVLESIESHNRILKSHPNFGMALANKAESISYYINLAPQQSLRLLDISKNLYLDALKDPNLEKVGGAKIRRIFEARATSIQKILAEENYSYKSIEKSIKSKYLSFCFQKNLFLNFDFGIYYDRESIKDTFTPTFIESSKETRSINQLMSDRVYISFQLFNQIIEAYTSARFSFFNASSSNTSKYDKLIRYSYTYDGIRHSYHSGLLKQVFCYLYNRPFAKVAISLCSAASEAL